MLSNGPGDERVYLYNEEIKKLYRSDVPIFAICGHQLMALANGADTYKMIRSSRRQSSVRDLETGRVYISSRTAVAMW